MNVTATEDSLSSFSGWYAAYHGYVSLCVCVSGIVTNTFNVTVLTRRKMRTPVNQILTGLALSDIITMLSYVPFAFHFYCMHPTTKSTAAKNSYGWMFFLLFHINLTTVTHTISIWLCVVLAIVRYLHIRNPARASSARFRRISQAKYLVLVVYCCSTLVMIPNYLTNELIPVNVTREEDHGENINETIWVLKSLKLGANDTDPLVLINVWQYAILAKVAPCFLMFIFGSLLLHQMRNKINQRRDFLKFSLSNASKLKEHSRTTKMLISVIVLFILTEFPQGVLIVLSATKEGFFNTVYLPLGDVMDIMALVNNAVNFVLYCSMSTKFRETFLCLYCHCRADRGDDCDDHDDQDDRVGNGYALRDNMMDSSCCNGD
ncbi:G-protein coupled receptor dmsr-1-like [Littorina saxatilis]|uniref:G-protein coupled receptors family 1 profile domain-containing protein n=1 Tax=Littorina saxatilis TaxID=31220 RepID=A0AAN9AWS9_9CAEN